MILADIIDYLSSSGIGTAGTDLFAGFAPDKPDAVTVVYETGGYAPTYAMNASAGKAVVEHPRVQVVCRNVAYEYAAARSKAHDVFKLLDGLPTRTINGTDYLWASAIQSPFPIGRDETGRVLIACNFDITKRLSA